MKRIVKIVLLLCLVSCNCLAYDFQADGVYYRITNRWKRTVEVTHWEEMTGEGGRPRRLWHHHDCCGHDHSKPLSRKHLKLIQLDEEAVQREKTAYIGKVVVPPVVKYRGIKYRVVGIGDGSFFNRKQLTEVELPEGITYIGAAAFENCVSLREVQLPTTVTRIGEAAFRRCMAFTTLTLPDNVRSIDVYAFAFCEELTSLRLSAAVDTFPGNIVFHCVKLKTIVVPCTVPPVVRNDLGLIMDFRKMTFLVPAAVVSRYRDDEFWRKQKLRAE